VFDDRRAAGDFETVDGQFAGNRGGAGRGGGFSTPLQPRNSEPGNIGREKEGPYRAVVPRWAGKKKHLTLKRRMKEDLLNAAELQMGARTVSKKNGPEA
jgi:hypothetical protein